MNGSRNTSHYNDNAKISGPLPAIAAVYGVGVIMASALTVPLPFIYGVLVVILVMTLLPLLRHGMPRRWLLLLLFFVTGILRFIQVDTLSPADVSHWHDHTVSIYGQVADHPRIIFLNDEEVKVTYHITVQSLQADGQQLIAASGGVLTAVKQRQDQPVARFGDYLHVRGRLLSIHGYNNPGAVDYAAALRRQGIGARMSVANDSLTIEQSAGSHAWARGLFALRQRLTGAASAALSPADAAVLNGMVFGGYNGIPATVVKEFAATGIVHILSVSGTHVALVAGVLMWLGARCGFSPALSAALGAVAVVAYVIVSGLTPPVIRSIFMGCAALGALVLHRENDAFTALSAAALVMLMYEPRWLYDISFQLSFGATAGLVVLYRPLTEILSRYLPPWLAGPLAVTAAAQCGVLPLLAHYFATFSLVSFPANVIVVPLVEIVVVLGLLAALASLANPWLGGGLYLLGGEVLTLVLKLTGWFATWPGATIYLPAGNFATGTAYYAALAWNVGLRPAWMPEPMTVWRLHPRWCAGTLLTAAGIFLAGGMAPQPLQVHFIDVGQGAASVLITPHNHVIMIDTGGNSGSDFDIGERVVVPYLRHIGVRHIDYLFLTHGHADHAGGAPAIVAALPVDNVIIARESLSNPVARAMQISPQTTFIPAYTGQHILFDGVRVTVMHSEGGVRQGNESSILIQVQYGRHKYLFTGDFTAQEEEQALQAHTALSSDVLAVAHHGARSSTTPAFLQAVRPDYAIIQAGYGNRFGHPHSEVLTRLEEHGVAVLRTDQDGAVIFHDNGEIMTVKKTVLPVH